MNTYRIRSYYGWHLGANGRPVEIVGYREARAMLAALRAAGDGCARIVKWEC